MKKAISFTFIFSFVLLLSACNFMKPEVPEDNSGTLIASFDEDDAPSKIVKTDNYWVYLVNTYGGTEYSISVNTAPEELNSVYVTKDVSIWFLEASDKYVVWTEKSDEYYEYKFYSIENKTVDTFFKTDTATGFQLQNIGIYADNIYYSFVDYMKEEANIYCYDVTSKEATPVLNLKYDEDLSPMSFSVENGFLSVASSSGVLVMDLSTGGTVFENELPDDVAYVFAISYDQANETCGLYYCDSDSEDIGIIEKDDSNIFSILTLNENYYAYHDQIKCTNGHIYWISQANVSGNVTDHYMYMDYDYINHEPKHTKRSIGFFVNEEKQYILRFDKDGNYENIELYERP